MPDSPRHNLLYATALCGWLGALLTAPGPVAAAPGVLVPSAELTLFDEGGVLDFASTGGHVGAIEATEDGVFVIIDSPSLGVLTTSLQLVKSTGMQTAELIGPPQPITLMPWASDLTLGPGGLLYVAGAMDETGGIFGLDPDGLLAPQPFATGSCAFSTTGLTFAADGSHALVSTDGSETSCANGLYRVWADGTTEHLITKTDVPDGIPRGTDDHAVMLDGRVILAGDKSHDLWDVTAGAGFVETVLELDELFSGDDIPGWAGSNPVFGSRVAVDPVTGDLYYSHGSGAPGNEMSIIRVSPDFSTASVFAEGFAILRDLDFGPAAVDNARSLYVVELRRQGQVPGNGDFGAVYEIALPADADADGLPDSADNCLTVANPDQRDADADGIGSACDPDLQNDCTVNFLDLAALKAVYLSDDPNADMNGDGFVNTLDLAIMKSLFLQPPGPSGVANACASVARHTEPR